MIASGGCTAVFLAYMEKLRHLTLVDMNPAQIALCKLKFMLASNFDSHDRLTLLGHKILPARERQNFLQDAFQQLEYDPNILGSLDWVAEFGPDFVGRYELLFKRLQYVIDDENNVKKLLSFHDLAQQSQFMQSHASLDKKMHLAFEEVMALPNLIKLFGEEATQNSVMSFSKHFYTRTLEAIHNFPTATNPYLAQMLMSQFTSDAVYPWLSLPKGVSNTQIKYCLSSMLDALLVSKEKYDFIHLSNILDWLNKEQATALLELSFKRLKEGGWVIIRQLNSSLDIPALYPDFYWDLDNAENLHKMDRSFFYQKLHIARKL